MKNLLTLVFGLLLCGSASALEIEGVRLEDKAQLGDVSLQLNGAGLRTKLFLNIYVGALYLPQKQTSADAIIAGEHERRVALHMLRGVSSKTLFGAFDKAIRKNHTSAELIVLDEQLRQMEQIFAAIADVKPADVIMLDYLPGSGTRITVNDMARGTIAGKEFYRALLKIWLGNNPVQQELKKGMLGG
jgi:hypothetical protein